MVNCNVEESVQLLIQVLQTARSRSGIASRASVRRRLLGTGAVSAAFFLNSLQLTILARATAVTSLQLSDDVLVSGSDDGEVKVWDFGPTVSGRIAAEPARGK